MQYVVEAIRAEGTSGWRTCDHDEAVLCMDGEVTVRLVKLETPLAPAGKEGSISVDGEPDGPEMGHVRIRRGHMALFRGSAYRFEAARPPSCCSRPVSATTRSSAGPTSVCR